MSQLTFDEFPPFEKQLFTLGHLAAVYQRSPQALLEVLRDAGRKPAWVLNNLAYFDGEAVQSLELALAEGQTDA